MFLNLKLLVTSTFFVASTMALKMFPNLNQLVTSTFFVASTTAITMTKLDKKNVVTSSWTPRNIFSGVESELHCNNICSKREDCGAFNYDQTIQSCQIGSPIGTIPASSNAPASSTTKLTLKTGCLKYGTNSVGNDLSQASIAKPSDCQKLCQTTNRCNYFSHYNGICWMKTSKGVATPLADYTSGPKYCDGCFTYDFNMAGFEISRIILPNVIECQVQCQINSACNYFTFETGQMCSLKSAPTALTTSIGYISGPKFCNECFVPATDYDQNDITISKTSSPKNCQMLCQANANCNFFTYNHGNTNCILKTSSAGKTPSNGATSGPKNC